MDHQQLREAVSAYALGALDPGERAALEAHLRGCDECAATVRAELRAAQALAFAVEPVEPPAGLRERVLRAAARTAPGQAPAPTSRRSLAPFYAVAASIAAVGLLAYAITLRARIERLETELQAANRRTGVAQSQLVALQARVEQASSMTTILVAADVRRVDLQGGPDAPEAAARAYWSPDRGLVFAGTRLPALPAGRVYQLWLVTATAPVSVGLLTPDESGRVNIVAAPPRLPGPIAAIAVTLEPAGGVPAPTGPKYLVGAL
jgi:anti-sigma-K factor RskA